MELLLQLPIWDQHECVATRLIKPNQILPPNGSTHVESIALTCSQKPLYSKRLITLCSRKVYFKVKTLV